MTKEEAKKRLPIIQAFAEGKPLQAMYLKGGYGVKYEDLDDIDNLDFENYEYRLKPEPKLRPYTFDEMCNAVKKHGILIKAKNDNQIYTMLGFDGDNVFYISESCETYEQFMANNVWFDDNSPCGVMEE